MSDPAEVGQALEAARSAGLAVSRETAERLVLLVGLVRRWNPTKNLVSPGTVADIWQRHVADCLQLVKAAPDSRLWADLGSGGGFPGLVIGAVMAERPGARVHCIESKLGKAAFLREAARRMAVPVTVHAERIESVLNAWPAGDRVDAVTARALAPLPRLVALAFPLLKTGAIGIFPKGQDVGLELTEASKYWNLDVTTLASATDPSGHIVVIRRAVPAAGRPL